jgi:hypothetical protein
MAVSSTRPFLFRASRTAPRLHASPPSPSRHEKAKALEREKEIKQKQKIK